MTTDMTGEDHHGPVLERQGEYEVIDCEVCGFAHILPFPNAESIERMYRETYYGEMIPDYIARHTKDKDWWSQVHASRLETMEALLPGADRRILDIGSGPGFFLLAARERGWSALGFEPSNQAWRHSAQVLGLEVRQEFFSEQTRLAPASFDAVHMSDVVEHIQDPRAMLRAVRRALRPGGVLCVATPNDFNPIQKALRKDQGFSPWWVSAPDHVNYFSFDSLQKLLERHGFDVRTRETSFPIDVFLLLGQDYTKDDALGQRCHGWRMQMERAFAKLGLSAALTDVYRALAKHGLGRHAVVYATARTANPSQDEPLQENV